MNPHWKRILWALVRRWAVTFMGVTATAWLPFLSINFSSFGPLIIAAVVLSVLHIYVRPMLILLTLPILVVTLGTFYFVINALLLLFTSYLVPGYEVAGFWSALGAGILMSLISLLLSPEDREEAKGIRSRWQVRFHRTGRMSRADNMEVPSAQPGKRSLKDEAPRNPPPGKGPIIDI